MEYPKIPKYQFGGPEFIKDSQKSRNKCLKGSCEDGNLRAKKSKPSKGRPFETRGLPKGISRRKAVRQIRRNRRREERIERREERRENRIERRENRRENRKNSGTVAKPRSPRFL